MGVCGVPGGLGLGGLVVARAQVADDLAGHDLLSGKLGGVHEHLDRGGCLGQPPHFHGVEPGACFVVQSALNGLLHRLGGVEFPMFFHHALVGTGVHFLLERLGRKDGKHQLVAAAETNHLGNHVRGDAVFGNHSVLAVSELADLLRWQHLLDGLKVQLELVIKLD